MPERTSQNGIEQKSSSGAKGASSCKRVLVTMNRSSYDFLLYEFTSGPYQPQQMGISGVGGLRTTRNLPDGDKHNECAHAFDWPGLVSLWDSLAPRTR